jgi:hypothetical protein
MAAKRHRRTLAAAGELPNSGYSFVAAGRPFHPMWPFTLSGWAWVMMRQRDERLTPEGPAELSRGMLIDLLQRG